MANKICSDTPLAAPPPASPRSPAASDAAPEAWVWFSLRPRRLRIFPRVSHDGLILSRGRAPAGWFERSGSKPREVRDYRFQPRSGKITPTPSDHQPRREDSRPLPPPWKLGLWEPSRQETAAVADFSVVWGFLRHKPSVLRLFPIHFCHKHAPPPPPKEVCGILLQGLMPGHVSRSGSAPLSPRTSAS